MQAIKFNWLLRRLCTDDDAFTEFYKFYYNRIVCRLKPVYGESFAEVVAQEFFKTCLSSPNKDYGYIKYPTQWVYKCCDNIAVRLVEKESRYVPVEYLPAADIDETERWKISDELMYLFDDVDELGKKIIALKFWGGYTHDEIAKLLNMSPAAVRQKYARTIRKLKLINGVSQRGAYDVSKY